MLRKLFFYPALFILCWIYAVKFNDVDYDFWARISVGKIFLQTGTVLHNDIFSYTLTKQWIDHEWGSGVIFYFLADKFGDIGIIALKITLMFTIMFLISKIIKLQNPEPNTHNNILFYLIILLAAFSGIAHTIRCQLFTFTLFSLWIYVLERVRRGETRLLWILPVTMLIWTNLHGGFVSGIGLLLIYGVGEFLNKKPYLKYFITLIPTSLVTLINPFGFNYLKYIFFATTLNRSDLIAEWHMTDLFRSWPLWYALKIVILISVISIVFYFIKNRPKFCDIDKVKFILLGITFYLALKHIKHQSFFIITAASFLYHDFYAMFGHKIPKIFNHLKEAVVYIVILGGGILLMCFNPILINLPINKIPVCSVEFIRQNNIKGNLVSVFHWGSYIAWKLYPNCLIAQDGRFEELYPLNTFMQINRLIHYSSLPEKNVHWDDFLNIYKTDIILASKMTDREKELCEVLKKNKNWKMAYEGPFSAVFIRSEIARDDYIKPELTPKKVLDEKYDTMIDFRRGESNALL